MKTLLMPQGSVEWHNARLGVVTASDADSLVTPKFKIKEGQGVETYLHRKLAEKLLNWSPEMLNSFPVDQGKLIETICLPWYEFQYETTVKRVGFCVTDDGRAGCSPDGILPDGTGLEVKAPQPPAHISYLLGGVVPECYLPQIHFSMLVTGAAHWGFVSYSMTLPPLVLRVERDEKIQAVLHEALSQFAERFDHSLARLVAMKEKL